MKLIPSFLALTTAILLGQAATVRADFLTHENIVVSGTVEQQTNEGKTDTPKKPISIALILKLLGITNVDAASLRFFYDSTDAGSFVLAPKTVESGADVTPAATLMAFNDSAVRITYNANRSTQSDTVSLLNGALPGITYGSFVYTAPTEQRTFKVTAAGSLNGVPTVLKLTIVERYKPQP